MIGTVSIPPKTSNGAAAVLPSALRQANACPLTPGLQDSGAVSEWGLEWVSALESVSALE